MSPLNANPVPTDAELEELGRSLDTPEIPSKLRCGICDLLAINTLRLPCCSTNICQTCYENEVTEECIICYHKPLDKSLCEPNKSMRITIKALLKKKYNDRAKRRVAAIKAAEVEYPTAQRGTLESVAAQGVASPQQNGESAGEGSLGNDKTMEPVEVQAQNTPMLNEDSKRDVPAESIEHDNPIAVTNRGSRKSSLQENEVSAVQEHDQQRNAGVAGAAKSLDADNHFGQEQRPAINGMNNFSMNSTPNFNGMNGMNGMLPMDFTSMMAGGMMPMTGFPNMMGMGMMPMMSQMFGGLDGSNMGMNGMGMGFNGQNQFGGPWMNGQDSFNNNSFGNGNFGAQGGFNTSSHQNNYNQMNDQAYANNDFQRGYGRQGFQNRRGRRGYYNGGYGRNHHNQAHQGNYQAYANPELPTQRASQKQTPQATSIHANEGFAETQITTEMVKEDEEALLNSFAPGGEHDFDEELGRKANDNGSKNEPENADTSTSSESKETVPTEVTLDEDKEFRSAEETQAADLPSAVTDEAVETQGTTVVAEGNEKDDAEPESTDPQPIQTFISDEPRPSNMPPPGPSIPTGPAALQGRSFSRGGMTPSSSSHTAGTPPVEPKGLGVVGAPTGPRALREGKPNTGWSGLDFSRVPRPSMSQSTEVKNRGRSKSRSPMRDQSPSQSRSRSRSPQKNHSSHHRSKRHRSRSESSGSRRERREDKRHHRSHRHHEDQEVDDRDARRASHRHYEDEEASDARRSGHKSNRHHEQDYPEDEAKYSSTRSHRRHEKDAETSERRRHNERARSRSPEHERERDREVSDRERHRHREEAVDDERRHRRRRAESPGSPSGPSPITARSAEIPDGLDDYSSRKRRTRDHEAAEGSRSERKRSRREYSPVGKASGRHSTSKPSTPATPTFPESTQSSRHGPTMVNGANRSKVAVSKPIPTGPRAAMQHQQSGRREREHEHNVPTAPAKKMEKDVHTLEREARDRERLQKEMLRRAYMDPNQRRKPGATPGRRMSYKYEDEGGSEARRVEREREAGRWS